MLYTTVSEPPYGMPDSIHPRRKPLLPTVSPAHVPYSSRTTLCLIIPHAVLGPLWTLTHAVPTACIDLCLDTGPSALCSPGA